MKKNKLIGVLAISCMMGLSGCDMLLGSNGCAHQWSPWEEAESSTCIERGIRERYCILCGDVQSRSIPVDTINGHLWMADPSSDKQATCSEPGVNGSQYCFRCYSRKKGNTTELGNHTWLRTDPQPSGAKYHDATCSVDGMYQEKCRDCNETRDITVAATGCIESANVKPIGNKGIGKITCTSCGRLIAYQLDITDATGYHKPTVRMYETSGNDSKAVWDISECIDTVIPEGTYDVEIEALMSDSAHGIRKWYNMARKDLGIPADIDANTTQATGSPDDVFADPYRYYMKVDETNYYPVTKESFADLGMHAGSQGVGEWSYCNFIEGLNLTKGNTKIELVHGNLNYYLYIRSLRFKPHTHNILEEVEQTASDRVGYTLEKCYCPYRKLTINAIEGTPSAEFDASAPEGFMMLNAVNDSVTYKINVEEGIKGNLYMVGKQTAANIDKTPFNISITNNGSPIAGDWEGKKASDYLDVEPGASPEEYSSERKILLGEITLLPNANGGTNVLTITRTGDYNIAMSRLVIEAMPTGHVHKFEHVASRDGVQLDKDATCYSEQTVHYECSCGQYEDREIVGTKTAHHLVEKMRDEASCYYTGTIVMRCDNPGCTYKETITIPKTHQFATTTDGLPDYATYELKKCTACENAYEATWMLNQDMIEDYNGAEYVPSTVEEKSGKMSDGINSFKVFKFDATKRRVVLKYKHNGANNTKAMFSLFGTTKASNIASCYAYDQAVGDQKGKKLDIVVNNYNYQYTPDVLDKTVGDLGLKNVKSQVSDSGELADPVWMDYLEISLKTGDNEIVVEVPAKTSYSLYLGGFRLTY